METKTYFDYVVLGAGIAGLAYANKMKSTANDQKTVVIFEKENYIGGLCHSFNINGFVFDSAVHLSFTQNDEVRKVFDKVPYYKHSPNPYNFYYGIWAKHPIVFNLKPFPVGKKIIFIMDYILRRRGVKLNNYSEWLECVYGRSLKRDFFDIYTRKYWTVDAKTLGISWLGYRVKKINLYKLLKGAFCHTTENEYYADEMRYPKVGGYQSFVQGLANGIDIRLGQKVSKICLNEKYIELSDKKRIYYGKLVSSIPLNEFVLFEENTPLKIKECAKRLTYTSVSIVSVGFNTKIAIDNLWLYVYDEDILAARINSPSIKSTNNVPAGCSSLQFEIYHTEPIEEKIIKENVKYAIKKMKIANEEDILFMDYRLLKYGNVIFYNGMDTDKNAITEYYKDKDVSFIGRFGTWDYLWSDQSFLSGVRGAEKDL